jgi:riboflavin kinase / FMN adenylyltransferase
MPGPTAVTIGNFDGVHLGHAALIRAARAAAGVGGKVVALAFDPHPLAILRPQQVPARLSTIEQRVKWLHDAGADEVVPMKPTAEFLRQTAGEFISFLVQRFAPSFVVEGEDFRFGRGREGTIETLKTQQSQPGNQGFRTVVVEPVEAALADQSVVRVSSSLVRWLLAQSRVMDEQRGRELGVPTANLAPAENLLPADGIYAGLANAPDGRIYPAAISIGTKPTFGEHPRLCEAHLIGYDGPLNDYGWPITVQFHHWLRDQLTYRSVEPLLEQLQRDIARAQELMKTAHTRVPKLRSAIHQSPTPDP